MKVGGSLPRGRRRRDEVPPVPAEDSLTSVQRSAQYLLRALVERSKGRFGSGNPIEVSDIDVLCNLFNEWALTYGMATDYGLYFNGQPGLWHALDELYPLQDPNRWDRLRQAVIAELESQNWTRIAPPRGSAFEIHALRGS